ncbi:hypothetical protein CMI41_00965 [Candidatus Pacearchaeota archaeon]|nr:hypothetical protein [Candidatus Pacearchaeota archaeon]|tara:strand:+ start:10405 stop:10635 length:231 start_codon:yes stop_codon:yes gene_type:complete
MVDNQWKNRFEEVVHETNDLESPDLLRKRELTLIVLKHLEEGIEEHQQSDWDSIDFKLDKDVFKAIFEDPEYYKFY